MRDHDWWERHPVLFIFGGGVLLTMLFVGVGAAIAYPLSAAACRDITDATGLRTDYRFWSGCYVEVGGKMLPEERWRRVEVVQ